MDGLRREDLLRETCTSFTACRKKVLHQALELSKEVQQENLREGKNLESDKVLVEYIQQVLKYRESNNLER